ncbi:MAG: hypothetical protein P1P63_09025 [Treponemataceae bacterium]
MLNYANFFLLLETLIKGLTPFNSVSFWACYPGLRLSSPTKTATK